MKLALILAVGLCSFAFGAEDEPRITKVIAEQKDLREFLNDIQSVQSKAFFFYENGCGNAVARKIMAQVALGDAVTQVTIDKYEDHAVVRVNLDTRDGKASEGVEQVCAKSPITFAPIVPTPEAAGTSKERPERDRSNVDK